MDADVIDWGTAAVVGTFGLVGVARLHSVLSRVVIALDHLDYLEQRVDRLDAHVGLPPLARKHKDKECDE